MRIGFGTTVWAKGLARNHLDGIGVYSQNLWHALENQKCELHGLHFGRCSPTSKAMPFTSQDCAEPNFNVQAALSSLTNTSFLGVKQFETKIDLFHAPDHHIPKLRHIPVVATIMDAIPLAHPEWVSQHLRLLKNYVFRRSAQWCQRIITISEFSKGEIAEHFHIPLERIDSIPLGVSSAFFTQLASGDIEKIIQKRRLVPFSFIVIGTLQPRKNVRRIIEAHRSLPLALQKEHPLLIIGKYGWGDEALLRDILTMQRDGRGQWLTDVSNSELLALLQSASAMLYPSLYEGFGLPILEAMASGVPVITSNVSSMPEVAG
ncbi:MAG TPA: glycosyltransferase family 1 protein, partial [bacterium]|nr:glycosyltransferase family 1 protein [bacterium]